MPLQTKHPCRYAVKVTTGCVLRLRRNTDLHYYIHFDSLLSRAVLCPIHLVVLKVLLVHTALILGASSPKKGAYRVCYCTGVPFFGTRSRKMTLLCTNFLVHQITFNQLHSSTKKLAPSTIFGTSDESGI